MVRLRTDEWALSRDVPEVVRGIVDLVAGEGLDGERRTVTAPTGLLCILWSKLLECGGDRLGRPAIGNQLSFAIGGPTCTANCDSAGMTCTMNCDAD